MESPVARLVRLTSLQPMKFQAQDIPEGKVLSICTCGLSQKFPICDGSHKAARASEQAGMLYVYNDARTQVFEVRPDPSAEGGPANPT
jgi:CDGSH-type Zn-finger protein